MLIKNNLVSIMKRLYKKKLISMRDGNISFKPKNKNYFYISAGSIKKSEINEDQIIKIDFSNNELNFNKDYKYQPSREIYMHSFLQTDQEYYNKDTFIIHAHPPNILAYMGTQNSKELKSIFKIFPEINVGNIGKNIKFHDAGSYELAKDCFHKLKKNSVVGLERHGSLSIGEDVDKLFEDIETLEYYLEVALKSKP